MPVPQIALEQSSDTPRFRQIVDRLKERIAVELVAHDAIPSERSVAEIYGVSRMTARRALETIEAEGLAYSEGRKGRFVSPQRLHYDISRVSFAAEAASAGVELDIELVEASTVRADQQLAQTLQVDAGEKLHKYTRLFRTNGHATFFETEYVIAKSFPDLLSLDLRQSTSKLLEAHYNIAAQSGDVVIRMRSLLPDEANLLGLKSLQTGIELEQTTYDESGVPFCFGRQIWRGEMAEFSVHAVVNR